MFIAFFCFFSVVSCQDINFTTQGKGQLSLHINNHWDLVAEGAGTLVTPPLSMDAAYYDVTGVSSTGSFQERTSEATFLKRGLEAGEWEIEVTAYNQDEIILGQGRIYGTIEPLIQTYVDLTVLPLSGTGGIELRVLETGFQEDSFMVNATLEDNWGLSGAVTIDMSAPGELTLLGDSLAAGYYTLKLSAYAFQDNSLQKLIDKRAAIYILNNRVSQEEVTLGDLLDPVSDDPFPFSSVEDQAPFEVEISSYSQSLTEGTSVTFSIPGELADQYEIQWYLNGDLLGDTATELIFSWTQDEAPPLRLGAYRIDLILESTVDSTIGTGSAELVITDQEEA